MATTLENLNLVLGKLQQNRDNITQQIVASTKALGAPSAEVTAAIDALIKEYGANVQVIGQTIGAKLQISEMEKALVEVDTMLAGLQVLLSDDATIAATDHLVSLGAPSPLSNAAGNSQPSAANDAASSEIAPASSPTVDTGVTEGASADGDSATA